MWCMNELPELSEDDLRVAALASILVPDKEEEPRKEEATKERESKEKVEVFPAESRNEAKCPRCNSTSLHVDKKGYGYGKGVVGLALAGPLGLFAGGIGAKKLKVSCVNCGHTWTLK